jgi:hypothetical protein
MISINAFEGSCLYPVLYAGVAARGAALHPPPCQRIVRV